MKQIAAEDAAWTAADLVNAPIDTSDHNATDQAMGRQASAALESLDTDVDSEDVQQTALFKSTTGEGGQVAYYYRSPTESELDWYDPGAFIMQGPEAYVRLYAQKPTLRRSFFEPLPSRDPNSPFRGDAASGVMRGGILGAVARLAPKLGKTLAKAGGKLGDAVKSTAWQGLKGYLGYKALSAVLDDDPSDDVAKSVTGSSKEGLLARIAAMFGLSSNEDAVESGPDATEAARRPDIAALAHVLAPGLLVGRSDPGYVAFLYQLGNNRAEEKQVGHAWGSGDVASAAFEDDMLPIARVPKLYRDVTGCVVPSAAPYAYMAGGKLRKKLKKLASKIKTVAAKVKKVVDKVKNSPIGKIAIAAVKTVASATPYGAAINAGIEIAKKAVTAVKAAKSVAKTVKNAVSAGKGSTSEPEEVSATEENGVSSAEPQVKPELPVQEAVDSGITVTDPSTAASANEAAAQESAPMKSEGDTPAGGALPTDVAPAATTVAAMLPQYDGVRASSIFRSASAGRDSVPDSSAMMTLSELRDMANDIPDAARDVLTGDARESDSVSSSIAASSPTSPVTKKKMRHKRDSGVRSRGGSDLWAVGWSSVLRAGRDIMCALAMPALTVAQRRGVVTPSTNVEALQTREARSIGLSAPSPNILSRTSGMCSASLAHAGLKGYSPRKLAVTALLALSLGPLMSRRAQRDLLNFIAQQRGVDLALNASLSPLPVTSELCALSAHLGAAIASSPVGTSLPGVVDAVIDASKRILSTYPSLRALLGGMADAQLLDQSENWGDEGSGQHDDADLLGPEPTVAEASSLIRRAAEQAMSGDPSNDANPFGAVTLAKADDQSSVIAPGSQTQASPDPAVLPTASTPEVPASGDSKDGDNQGDLLSAFASGNYTMQTVSDFLKAQGAKIGDAWDQLPTICKAVLVMASAYLGYKGGKALYAALTSSSTPATPSGADDEYEQSGGAPGWYDIARALEHDVIRVGGLAIGGAPL
jgi:outer membrane murein-binding lipoprotein Lpp